MLHTDSSAGRPQCVLLLQDSPTLLTQVSRILRARHPSLQILAARGVAEARVLAAEYPVDLFLLDLDAMDGSAISLLLELRERHPHAKTLIVAAGPISESRARNRGALQFLERRTDSAGLCEQIGLCMEPPSSHGRRIAGNGSAEPLSALSPVDLIQFAGFLRASAAVEFTGTADRRGRFYFRRGDLVHAEAESARGVAAVCDVLGWDSWSVRELKDAPEPPLSICERWPSLLRQALKCVEGER